MLGRLKLFCEIKCKVGVRGVRQNVRTSQFLHEIKGRVRVAWRNVKMFQTEKRYKVRNRDA